MKRFISMVLCLLICISLSVNTYAYSEKKAPELDYSNIVGSMTAEEFFALSSEEQLALVERCYEVTFPTKQSKPSARYKSGDKDGTHQPIAAMALSILDHDKGFWIMGTEGIGVILRIAIFAGAPDHSDDESYVVGNSNHFYVVDTGKGLNGKESSSVKFVEYYNKAKAAQKRGDNYLAAEHLGRALHYVQDASVPHHTISYLTIAHANYEKFCSENVETYLSELEDPYSPNTLYPSITKRALNEIVPFEAEYSHAFYGNVNTTLNQSKWGSTASQLIKRSTKVSAAILYKFALDSNLTLS